MSERYINNIMNEWDDANLEESQKYRKEYFEILMSDEGFGSEQILPFIEEGLKKNPAQPHLLYNRVEYYLWHKEFDKAMNYLREVSEIYPEIKAEIVKEIEVLSLEKEVIMKKKMESWHIDLACILIMD